MDPSTKLRHCLELADLGRDMHRHSLRRRHPEWSERELAAAFRQWLAGPSHDGTPRDGAL